VIGEVWDDQEIHSKLVYEVFVPYFISESFPAGITMRYWYDDWPIPGTPISEEFHLAISAAETILAEIDRSIH